MSHISTEQERDDDFIQGEISFIEYEGLTIGEIKALRELSKEYIVSHFNELKARMKKARPDRNDSWTEEVEPHAYDAYEERTIKTLNLL